MTGLWFMRIALLFGALFYLSACNTSSLGDGLGPSVVTAQDQSINRTAPAQDLDTSGNTTGANALAPQDLTSAGTSQAGAQIAALDTGNTLTFLPVEGAPQGTVTSLSRQLKLSAGKYGLSLVPGNLPGAKYRVKGFFSALNDGSGTLVVYIWDVYDSSGKRVHRINGQERSGSTRTNPWQAVTETEIAKLSDTTAARLKTWVETRKQ